MDSSTFIAFWAIFAVFGLPFLIIMFTIWIINREKRKSTQAIVDMYTKAIEKGGSMPPDFPELPIKKKSNPLNTGIILISVGLGISLFMLLHKGDGAKLQAMALGIIPFILGIGYLTIHLISKKQNHSENAE